MAVTLDYRPRVEVHASRPSAGRRTGRHRCGRVRPNVAEVVIEGWAQSLREQRLLPHGIQFTVTLGSAIDSRHETGPVG
jgi:hypothetical protein